MRQEARELLWTYLIVFIITIMVCMSIVGCSDPVAGPHTAESDLFGEPIVLDTTYVTE